VIIYSIIKTNEQARLLTEELKSREIELQKQTIDLMKAKQELEASSAREANMRTELECWVPPFVLWALKEPNIKFPIKRDIVGVTFDIIQSSKIHDLQVDGKPLRSLVIQAFSEAIIRHGGWRESHSGDSAYGHFGLLEDRTNPYEAALAVAREFRVALRGISTVHNVAIECGIALHVAKDSTVDVHTVQLNTPRGIVTQKSFDTTSTGIDLLHRMEKIVHDLPGTNIIMSEHFVKNLRDDQQKFNELGGIVFKGQKDSVKLYLIPSDKASAQEIDQLKAKYFKANESSAA
jgi:class 3 adenylate cyclase